MWAVKMCNVSSSFRSLYKEKKRVRQKKPRAVKEYSYNFPFHVKHYDFDHQTCNGAVNELFSKVCIIFKNQLR